MEVRKCVLLVGTLLLAHHNDKTRNSAHGFFPDRLCLNGSIYHEESCCMESLDANENMCTFLYSCKKIK